MKGVVIVSGTSGKARSSIRSVALMGGGTAMVGASGYAFVALAGHTMPPVEFAAVSSFYLLANIIGPGIFVALEQETNRATSSGIALGKPIGPAVRRAAVHGSGLLCAVFLALAALTPVLLHRVLLGHWALLVATAVSAVTAGAVYLVRGALGGMRRFDGYSATLAVDGVMRLVPALAVAAAGAAAAGLFGFVFAFGSGFASLVGLRWLRRGARASAAAEPTAFEVESAPADAGLGTVRGLTLLVGATLLAQVVANLAPLVVTARLVDDAALAGAFASAFILARVPLFVFSPAQALVLPSLSAAATRRDHAAARRVVRMLLLIATALGAAGTVAAATVGPWAVQTFFGARVALPATVLGLLGLSTLLLMCAQLLQAALVAYRAHHAATVSWAISTAVLVGGLAVPIPAMWAAVLAQLTASCVVVAAMLTTLLPRMRSSPAPVSALHPIR